MFIVTKFSELITRKFFIPLNFSELITFFDSYIFWANSLGLLYSLFELLTGIPLDDQTILS